MDNLLAFLGLGSLIGLSIMFALWLEWLSLRALLHLMPGRAAERQADGPPPVSRRQVNLKSSTRLAPARMTS
jgi:hypothetical protein